MSVFRLTVTRKVDFSLTLCKYFPLVSIFFLINFIQLGRLALNITEFVHSAFKGATSWAANPTLFWVNNSELSS